MVCNEVTVSDSYREGQHRIQIMHHKLQILNDKSRMHLRLPILELTLQPSKIHYPKRDNRSFPHPNFGSRGQLDQSLCDQENP